jgi:hypothetical protein
MCLYFYRLFDEGYLGGDPGCGEGEAVVVEYNQFLWCGLTVLGVAAVSSRLCFLWLPSILPHVTLRTQLGCIGKDVCDDCAIAGISWRYKDLPFPRSR